MIVPGEAARMIFPRCPNNDCGKKMQQITDMNKSLENVDDTGLFK